MILKPLILVFIAFCGIVGSDSAGKILGEAGINSYVLTWLRFSMGAFFLLPFSGLKLSELRYLLSPLIILRAFLITGTIVCILTALETVDVADAFAAFFIGPVVSYFLAALFLNEKITMPRTILLFIGLIGVMLVVKPGGDMKIGMIFALASGCFYGSFMVVTRKIANDYRPKFLLLSHLILGTLILLPVGSNVPISLIGQAELLPLAISAFGSLFGNYLLVIVSRTTPASLLSPLVYSQLIAAMLIGYFVFDTWPDMLAFIGLLIILASGGFSLIFYQKDKSSDTLGK